MPRSPRRLTRREFVKAAGATVALPSVLSSVAFGAEPAAATVGGAVKPLNLGFIGIGKMGWGHLQRFVGYPDLFVTAVSDVDTTRREHARAHVDEKYKEFERKGAPPCKAHANWRDLLADPSVDAVLIATPDHWHAAVAIEACKAKKDIYCEKPLTLTIHEGKALIDAVRKHERVFQTGSQQRSEGPFRDAVNLIRAGRLGKIKSVEVAIGPTSKPCDLPGQPPHAGLDWNEWLGQSPQREYNEVLCRNGLPDSYPFNPGWRDYREFSGGYVTDWGAHHYDITQWALDMDQSGPAEIYPPEKQGDQYGVRMIYRGSPAGDEIAVVHAQNIKYQGEKDGRPQEMNEGNGILFVGEKGKLFVNRGVLATDPVEIGKEALSEGDKKLPPSRGDHHQDWLKCIQTRERAICDVEVGARSVTVCHLANLAYWNHKPLKWDAAKWEFTGENAEEANKARTRDRRKGFELPEA